MLEALKFCFENNIVLCRLPSHTSHKLQPCDVGVFAPLKAAYRDKADRMLRGGATAIGKQHFTSLYSLAREKAFTERNITAAWAACGLFPFNPERVLRVTPKPPAQASSLRADGTEVGSCHQEVPQTPVTPVSAGGLTSLHDLIKQDARTLNAMGIQRLERHVQKLADTTQISFAERALLHDQNRMLVRINNEVKVRRSTRSVILGKAKVMSFEDLEVARAARAAKEVINGKGRRGRKRKGTALEVEVDPEPGLGRAAKEAIKSREKRGRKREGAAQDADKPEPKAVRLIKSPKPWQALVAYMGEDLSLW